MCSVCNKKEIVNTSEFYLLSRKKKICFEVLYMYLLFVLNCYTFNQENTSFHFIKT